MSVRTKTAQLELDLHTTPATNGDTRIDTHVDTQADAVANTWPGTESKRETHPDLAGITTGISPLKQSRQREVIERTQHFIDLAEQQFDLRCKPVEIHFNLKGRTAGMYRSYGSLLRRKREIRYNPYIFAKYYQDNLDITVPHEVAHYISDLLYGLKNIRPHGKEWKAIMHAFGADDSVTADFDLQGIPQRRQRYHRYRCACRKHQISTTRHNRITRGHGRYYCQHCQQLLFLDQD